MNAVDVSCSAAVSLAGRAISREILSDCLHLQAQQKPDQLAFRCDGAEISWSELNKTSTALARWFLDQGLKSGDRVAVCSLNSLELVQIYLGLFRARVIAVPINTRLKPDEVRFIFGHAKPKLVFCEPAFASTLQLAGTTCPIFSQLPDLAPATMPSADLPSVQADDLAVIIYTSGTTSTPKGVAHTHGSLRDKGMNGSWITGQNLSHVRLCFLPMMHVSGLWCLAMALCEGSPTILLSRFEPGAALDAIEHFGCTTVGGLPTMLLCMLEEQTVRPRKISTLRWAFGGGDVVSPTLQTRFQAAFGAELHEIYAMTEICPIAANVPGARRAGSVGLPLQGIDVRIVDHKDRDVAEGETGEITVRGSSLCVGYWNDPEATNAAMGNGWLRTGDLGAQDADGFIWFKGRKKEVIIRAGSNISPQEVEDALYKHPAVLEVGVIGIPDPITMERVVAFIVLREGHVTDAEELIAFARQHIADYKTPEEIYFRNELPKNAVGKVQRRALKKMLPAH